MTYSKDTIFLMTLTLAREGHKESCQKLLTQVSAMLKQNEELSPEIAELVGEGLNRIAQDANEARSFVVPKTGSGNREQNIEALLVFAAIDEMLAADSNLKMTQTGDGPGAFNLYSEKIGMKPSHVKDRYYEGEAFLKSRNSIWSSKFLSMSAELENAGPIKPPES